MVSFDVSDELGEQMMAAVKLANVSRSAWLREAVENYLRPDTEVRTKATALPVVGRQARGSPSSPKHHASCKCLRCKP